jgi:hypothetical protein
METPPEKNEINTLHSEHLMNGECPIIACVEGYYDNPVGYDGMIQETVRDFIQRMKKEEKIHEEERTGGLGYFVTSVSSEGKMSEGFLMCTGLVAVGKEKESKKNISFLSHEMPFAVLSKSLSVEFFKDVSLRLFELKEKSVPGSIDVVIVGGQGTEYGSYDTQTYEKVIAGLKDIVKNEFGFEPTVIVGPKLPLGDESLYFDTENRRLYISRPKVGDATTESFMPKDINTQAKKWENEAN